MKKAISPLVCLLMALCACSGPEYRMSEPVDYVNTLMGTASTYNLSAGNTYPAVAVPWGMHFWTPQTGTDGNGWSPPPGSTTTARSR